MNESISIFSTKADLHLASRFLSALRAAGYEASYNCFPVQEEAVNALILSDDTTMEDLFAEIPWLKAQYEYCSYPHLKLMPVFVYASSKVDPEEAFEGHVGEIYEELMSGEFKPFGFDLDNKNPLEEFPRIYEEYAD